MRELSSVKNPIVQAARALATAKGRAEQGAFVLDGEHMILEALNACPRQIRTLLVDAERLARFKPLITRAEAAGADSYLVPARVLESVSQVKTPQGVAAVCGLPAPAPLHQLGDKLLLLEDVQDPGNVGTILRTLDAAGFDGCVLTRGCADPYAPKTLRATMGSVFRVPLAFADDAAHAVRTLVALGYAAVGTALDGLPFYQRQPLPPRLCVLIGNEGSGLSPAALAACAHRYRLPMRGGAESLNAAIAAAVVMYDLVNR